MSPEDEAAKRTRTGGQFQFDWIEASKQARQPEVTSPGDEPTDESFAPEAVNSAERHDGFRYDPGHPWHYLPQGDDAWPLPFESIPASEESGRALVSELPKSRVKRIVKVREWLDGERQGIEAARVRYHDVVERGAEALSRYDREIAYGGDGELARAGTLALLFNQIAWRRGRIAALECEAARQGWKGRGLRA